MKTGILTAALGATLALSCASTRAQDTSRVPDLNKGADAVDASVHADVEETAHQQPQPLRETAKLPATYSRWGFSSSDQLPATRFWPAQFSIPATTRPAEPTVWSARAADATVSLANDEDSGGSERRQGLSHGLNIGRAQSVSTGRQPFKTSVLPFDAQPHSEGFSMPLLKNEFEMTGISHSLSDPFPLATFSSHQERTKAKLHNRRLQRSPDSNHTLATASDSTSREKPGRSRLTANYNN